MNLQEKLPVIYLFSLITHNYWLVRDSGFGSQNVNMVCCQVLGNGRIRGCSGPSLESPSVTKLFHFHK